MLDYGFTEADWKLFRKRLPEWQERYMEKLVEEYLDLLSTDEPASTRFWNLEERIKKDKKDTGVLAEDISRSNMRFLMMDLINEGAITESDLHGFSDEYKQLMVSYCNRVI